jgi:hypothetical protein
MASGSEQSGDVEVVRQPGADGRPYLEARVPRIDRRFRSVMHQPENVAAQLGSWRAELALVLARQAPVARLVPDAVHLLAASDPLGDAQAIRRAVVDAVAGGLAGGITVDAEGIVCGRVGLVDPVEATVDLAALRTDYEAWFAAARVLDAVPDERWGAVETVAELVGYAFDDLAATTWSEHLWELDRYSTGTVEGGIKHGLVTGRDPACSCAFILSHITGDRDRWWRPLRGPRSTGPRGESGR